MANTHKETNAVGKAAMQVIIAKIAFINSYSTNKIEYTEKNGEDRWEVDIETTTFYHADLIALAATMGLSVIVTDNYRRDGEDKEGHEVLIRIYVTYLPEDE